MFSSEQYFFIKSLSAKTQCVAKHGKSNQIVSTFIVTPGKTLTSVRSAREPFFGPKQVEKWVKKWTASFSFDAMMTYHKRQIEGCSLCQFYAYKQI